MGKISLSNIAEELAAKAGLSRESANNFAHAFVDTVEKGLQADGVVKVKGLGTFKLQEVSDRDSVDVNTGERITIKGYRKVTFTPDTVMKEFVNRPFAHFEPTELNEGYPTEEESVTDDPTEEPTDTEEPTATEPIVEPEIEPIVVEPTTEPSVAEESTIVNSPIAEELVVESVDVVLTTVDEPVTATPTIEEPIDPPAKPRRRRGCLWILFTLLLLVAGIAFLYLKGWLPSMVSSHSKESVSEQNDIPVRTNLEEELKEAWGEVPVAAQHPDTENSTATIAVVEPASQETQPAAEEEIKPVSVSEPKSESKAGVLPLTASLQAKTIKDITLADTTDYSISGTMLTHKLKSGETIIQLSNRYYGDKRLWPYIVKHNQMKNFNSVAIGQEIRIPVLEAR